MPLVTLAETRKEKRKEKRKKRKQRHGHQIETIDVAPPVTSDDAPLRKKAKRKEEKKTEKQVKKQTKTINSKDKSSAMDPDLAAAIRRDDEEIAELEAKLGLKKSKKGKEKLNKEYSKLEGYGDDFGDFLDDLDNMCRRVRETDADGPIDDDDDVYSDEEDYQAGSLQNTDVDPDIAAALRRDDEEIRELEEKLGMKSKKNKSKLYKEYSMEGYGDDFGSFLDGLDDVMVRVSSTSRHDMKSDSMISSGEDDSFLDESEGSEDEELVPMKDPYEALDEDDSVLDEVDQAEREAEGDDSGHSSNDDQEESDVEEEDQAEGDLPGKYDSNSDSESDDDDDSALAIEPDHDEKDTYRPSQGEDIYGNKFGAEASGEKKPTKYVPPHLRKSQNADDADQQEKMRMINRLLNNALNRLSEDTLISVAQQLAQVYSSNPTQMVHEGLWKNTLQACVNTPMVMTGLIPIYVACMVGAHIQTGDTIQIGEYMLEQVVAEMWKGLQQVRAKENQDGDMDGAEELESKSASNLMLILCYLYNFNFVHCSFMYDIIRHLINGFSEVDIECLLLLLSHCGRSLRSDDPLALKEIVLLVKKKNYEESKVASSRAEYMVSAIMDLKNNKGRKQDNVFTEKTSKLKKTIGRIKTAATKTGRAKTSSEASLRISLQDILDAETKGRWWKVGASWIGNQYRFGESEDATKEDNVPETGNSEEPGEDEELLRLASKFRMNTDRKRAIFCIVMGGSDCEDAFEKLCRSSMLQNRSERDTVRVLMECCGNEKSYNKFYGHLANRICEYQPQCRFSLQLAYWDAFKQFDSMGARKAANMAKLLFNLVMVHQVLKLLPVLRGMDISEDELDDSQTIFLTILMSSILDYAQHPEQAKSLFAVSDPSKEEQNEGIRAGLLMFFMGILKASPKNKKGSNFRKNFKAVVKELDSDGFESMF